MELANEATILQTNALEYRQITIGDGSAVPKGTLIILEATPNIGNIASTSFKHIPAGVAAVEKTANDGQTTIPILVRGDVTMVADGTVTIGDLVTLGTTANRVRSLGALSIEHVNKIIGQALSTASDGNTFTCRLRLG